MHSSSRRLHRHLHAAKKDTQLAEQGSRFLVLSIASPLFHYAFTANARLRSFRLVYAPPAARLPRPDAWLPRNLRNPWYADAATLEAPPQGYRHFRRL